MTALSSPDTLELPDPDQAPEDAQVEVDSVLAAAMTLRFPDVSDKRGVQRVEALADHIMETAIVRGDLEQLRLEAHVGLLRIRKQLGAMPAAGRNRAAVEEARRTAAPELAEEHDHLRWIVDRCTEQINRLGGTDYDAASRAYTLLAGT